MALLLFGGELVEQVFHLQHVGDNPAAPFGGALVTLTHDPKLDDPAIMKALKAPIFYLGCLGSKKTHGKRVERLTEAGFSEAEIARIHGPVGLDIGAKSPAEIAISILAQITEVLHRTS